MQYVNVKIAMPSHSSQVYAQTMEAWTRELLFAVGKGYILHLDQLVGSSDISAIRSAYLARFLADKTMQNMVYIDADLEWPTGAIVQLLEHKVDFVVGGYPAKAEPEQYRVHFKPGPIHKRNPLTNEIVGDDDPRGLIEINRAPGGMVCISRNVASRMSEAYSDLRYADGISPSGHSVGVFDCLYADGLRWSEDLAFCMRWRDIGGKVWLDPNISMSHWGIKGYAGNLESHLRTRAAKEQERAAA